MMLNRVNRHTCLSLIWPNQIHFLDSKCGNIYISCNLSPPPSQTTQNRWFFFQETTQIKHLYESSQINDVYIHLYLLYSPYLSPFPLPPFLLGWREAHAQSLQLGGFLGVGLHQLILLFLPLYTHVLVR